MRRALAVMVVLQGCFCASQVGLPCSAAAPCARGLCDTGVDGGYCSMPCGNALPGQWCAVSGDQADGICGLVLSDGGVACGQPCLLDGGGGGLSGVSFCRTGHRCAPAPACPGPGAFGCPTTDGLCVP